MGSYGCRDVITAEEMGQYEEQYKHIKRILRMYETEPDNFGELLDALQQVRKMYACKIFVTSACTTKRQMELASAKMVAVADQLALGMQMQACGQPPQDIVNDLAPGMAFDQEGLPSTLPGSGHPPGCCVQ